VLNGVPVYTCGTAVEILWCATVYSGVSSEYCVLFSAVPPRFETCNYY